MASALFAYVVGRRHRRPWYQESLPWHRRLALWWKSRGMDAELTGFPDAHAEPPETLVIGLDDHGQLGGALVPGDLQPSHAA